MEIDDKIINAEKIAGLKQSTKMVEAGRAKVAYAAHDAQEHVAAPFMDLCKTAKVEVVRTYSMKELGEICRVEVPTAFMVIVS